MPEGWLRAARLTPDGHRSGPDTLVGMAPDRSAGDLLGTVPPLPLRTGRVVLVGVGLWMLALVVTLAVPALHSGDRHWWPWTCVAGAGLGLLGYAYLRRGRGNARDAH